jgi:hypothetical protein
VEITSIPTGMGGADIRLYLNGAADLTTRAQIAINLEVDPVEIRFGHDVSGVSQGSTTITYSSTSHRWLAIVHRETGGAGTFDWYTAQTPVAAPPQDGSAGPTNGWTRRWQDASGFDPTADQQVTIFQNNASGEAANVGDLVIANVNTGW